jgi:hypothetical protein
MLRRPTLTFIPLTTVAALLVGGCLEPGDLLSTLRSVQVEVVNDTDFAVDPNIRYDDDAGFFASLLPADTLDTGLIESGEIAVYTFDCDELGLVLSDEAEQVVPLFGDYVADETDILERGDDYDCGDSIRFRFVGNAADFGVIVSVNGQIVD